MVFDIASGIEGYPAVLCCADSIARQMKGSYCLVIHNPSNQTIKVGALGRVAFPKGIYVYVGSALGGIEKRVKRHLSKRKRLRWHIDYFLSATEVVSKVYIPGSSKETECDVARALFASPGAAVAVPGFGSSDCRCKSHLVFFGDVDPEWAAETLSMSLTMLSTIYPRTC